MEPLDHLPYCAQCGRSKELREHAPKRYNTKTGIRFFVYTDYYCPECAPEDACYHIWNWVSKNPLANLFSSYDEYVCEHCGQKYRAGGILG